MISKLLICMLTVGSISCTTIPKCADVLDIAIKNTAVNHKCSVLTEPKPMRTDIKYNAVTSTLVCEDGTYWLDLIPEESKIVKQLDSIKHETLTKCTVDDVEFRLELITVKTIMREASK